MTTLSRRLFLPLWILVLATAGPSRAESSAESATRILSASRSSLARFLVDPETATFRAHLKQARAVLIVPKRVRAGLIVGGHGGVGVLVARDPETGTWGEPAFYNLGGASLGLQVGGDRSELILVVTNEAALDGFLSSRFELGAEVAVAAGPIGGGSGEQLGASIVAFVRSKGLYAGAALAGTAIRPAVERNAAYYGAPATPVDILVRRTVSSESSIGLREDLARAVAEEPAAATP